MRQKYTHTSLSSPAPAQDDHSAPGAAPRGAESVSRRGSAHLPGPGPQSRAKGPSACEPFGRWALTAQTSPRPQMNTMSRQTGHTGSVEKWPAPQEMGTISSDTRTRLHRAGQGYPGSAEVPPLRVPARIVAYPAASPRPSSSSRKTPALWLLLPPRLLSAPRARGFSAQHLPAALPGPSAPFARRLGPMTACPVRPTPGPKPSPPASSRTP